MPVRQRWRSRSALLSFTALSQKWISQFHIHSDLRSVWHYSGRSVTEAITDHRKNNITIDYLAARSNNPNPVELWDPLDLCNSKNKGGNLYHCHKIIFIIKWKDYFRIKSLMISFNSWTKLFLRRRDGTGRDHQSFNSEIVFDFY